MLFSTRCIVPLAVFLLLSGGAGATESGGALAAAEAAHARGDYETALALFLPLAERGDAGALIQIIMAARVLYGLAAQGWLPADLARVNARTRTPLAATALATGVVLALALWLPLVTLAEITSLITLIIFTVVNLSL